MNEIMTFSICENLTAADVFYTDKHDFGKIRKSDQKINYVIEIRILFRNFTVSTWANMFSFSLFT